ncbi:nucleoside recognition domain-containing protein [Marinobacterium sedimentorum]|uniref:nucleoside recognition domain-containing protein n=1 Tax=Marinobacterium sedimentorum TaxID=2927804 RepID=UPI0020C6F338|nr:nucleoside recognition domain-containing protein [Marinobacterium sedimentorum]MCP8688634.1 nucleoside recognition family protein [Marinobacterium sedimentorum]
MDSIVSVIMQAGRTGIELALYVLLPIMVVMLALMKLLEARGVLAWVANALAPVLRIFGLPGLGIFAMVKLLLVSFSAPVATLALMDRNGTSLRHIAATLAMVLTMSQANVVFPMLSVGLNLPVILATSVIGGLFAASVTYYLLARGSASEPVVEVAVIVPGERRGTMEILAEGGQEGMKIALASLPILILALCFVYTLQASGAITLISAVLAPMLALLGLPEAAVLPIVTKFIAGGTAFMGVVLDLMNQGLISAADLNRMAGFVTNPLDLAGVAIMTAAGKRVGRVARAAVWGALAGMLLRGVLHLLIF